LNEDKVFRLISGTSLFGYASKAGFSAVPGLAAVRA
jgi:hypothetical protein